MNGRVRGTPCAVRREAGRTVTVGIGRYRSVKRKHPLPPVTAFYRLLPAVIVVLLSTPITEAEAQRPGMGQPQPPVVVDESEFSQFNAPYDGRFTFVRLRYTALQTGYGGGGGFFGGVNFQWDHDYPRADRNFTQLIGELTAVETSDGHNILSVGDPDIFKYPLAYLVEPGWMILTDDEATNLRNYMMKGGFIIFDDFADNFQLRNFVNELDKILPDGRLVRLSADHKIFHSFFDIESLDFYHPYRGLPSMFLGVFEDNDPEKRLLLVANYNNDIGESWEYSDTGFIPIEISNVAYKLGVNYVMYAMTH